MDPVRDPAAEILLEVRQEILDLLSQTQSGVRTVLSSLGPPAQAARKRRMERGLGPGPHARADQTWRKWVLWVLLAAFLALVVGAILLVRSFSPIVEVDEEAKKVTLLGGRIVVDTEKADVKIGGKSVPITHFSAQRGASGVKVKGFAPAENLRKIRIRAKSGRFSFRPSKESAPPRVSYACDLREGATEARFRDAVQPEGDTLVMDLDEETGTGNCAFLLPPKAGIDIEVESGIVELAFLRQDVRARVGNGVVLFAAEKPEHYSVKARVTRGLVTLTQGERAGAPYSADLEVTHGSINQIR